MTIGVDKQAVFIDSLVNHVEREPLWDSLSKREVVILVGMVLMHDVGAAQDFLDACNCKHEFICANCNEKINTTDPNQLELKFDVI